MTFVQRVMEKRAELLARRDPEAKKEDGLVVKPSLPKLPERLRDLHWSHGCVQSVIDFYQRNRTDNQQVKLSWDAFFRRWELRARVDLPEKKALFCVVGAFRETKVEEGVRLRNKEYLDTGAVPLDVGYLLFATHQASRCPPNYCRYLTRGYTKNSFLLRDRVSLDVLWCVTTEAVKADTVIHTEVQHGRRVRCSCDKCT